MIKNHKGGGLGVRFEVTSNSASKTVASWTLKIEKVERIFGCEAVLSPNKRLVASLQGLNYEPRAFSPQDKR